MEAEGGCRFFDVVPRITWKPRFAASGIEGDDKSATEEAERDGVAAETVGGPSMEKLNELMKELEENLVQERKKLRNVSGGSAAEVDTYTSFADDEQAGAEEVGGQAGEEAKKEGVTTEAVAVHAPSVEVSKLKEEMGEVGQSLVDRREHHCVDSPPLFHNHLHFLGMCVVTLHVFRDVAAVDLPGWCASYALWGRWTHVALTCAYSAAAFSTHVRS